MLASALSMELFSRTGLPWRPSERPRGCRQTEGDPANLVTDMPMPPDERQSDTQAVKENPETANIPIVILSWSASESSKRPRNEPTSRFSKILKMGSQLSNAFTAIFCVARARWLYHMPVSARPASAEKSAAAKSLATHLGKAAAAIMAALSVESGREGKNTSRPSIAAFF